ncbi:MAG: delta-60 repeat domain-containing protein [Solirubrobacteraceae bacterium]|nr:delta-60 repeat domain-containing protein [Solirubrobacteraceae bacterium]
MRGTNAKLLVGALTAGAAFSGAATAQAGFDPTYGVGGIATVPLSSSADRFLGSTPGPGGTTYAVGFTTSGSADQSFVLAKLRSDGSRDAEFGTNGAVSVNLRPAPFAQPPANADGTFPATPGGNQEVARGVVVQSDGKIVVTGQAETPASPAPFDTRDVDVYAVRFNADGTLDTTYGGSDSPDPAPAGVSRINMTDGDSAANTLLSDNAWGAVINPDDTVVIEASRGVDIGADPAKTDRDLAMIKLDTDGDLDTSFNGGAGGVPGISIAGNTFEGTPLNDNARRPKLDGDKIVAASYGAATGITNKPAVYRFLPDGALDTSYSGDGIATGEPLGPQPAFSEAYDVGVQEGGRYVLTGYGNTATPGSTVDMVSYRFTAAGDLDPTYGSGGATRYDAGLGLEDRGRDINVTSEGRIVIAGSSATAAGDLIAAVYLLRPNGKFETTFGVGGAMKVDMGGTVDAFFGLSDTLSDTRATVAGYRGTGGATDDAAVVRLNLDLQNTGPAGAPGPQGSPGPQGPQGPQGLPGVAGGGGSGTTPPPAAAALVNRKARIGTMKRSGSTVSVPLSCTAGARCKGTVRLRSVAPVRVGRSRKVISVTRTASFHLKGTAKRTVRLALSKAGKTALNRSKRLSVKIVVDPASGSLVTKRGTLRR